MQNKPDNLTWWNERSDVDSFYSAMDLFLFTSKGNNNDKETMPLVIREAISWQLPILIYNLPVYLNYFDKFSNIQYLEFNNIKKNCNKINNMFYNTTADDFDLSFEGENKINIFYKNSNQFNCNIVIKEKYSDAPMYWFEASFINYNSWFCTPNQGFSIKDSWITELTIEFYNLQKEFLFSKDLFLKEKGIKPTMKLDLINPFDCLFYNYDEMFISKKYDFLFENKLNIVLDIGANAGTFSKLFLEKGVSKVYAFEPNQDALINLNYLASKNNNLKVIEKAVYINEENLKFYTDLSNTTIGSFDQNHVTFNSNSNIKESIVPTTTIKNFIKQENLTKIDLIKMDIEGAEYDIIENLEDEIFNITNRFLIEWHNNSDSRIEKLISKLISKGYFITKIFNQNNNEDLTSTYKDSVIGTFLAEKKYKVTVVVPTYNHEKYIEQCVNSVLNQKTNFNFNILISDDCSTDNTFNILQKYKDIPNIIIHQELQNIGPIGIRCHNLYQMCSSEYITLLDGDDYYTDPYKLQKQVNYLDANPEYIIHSMGCNYTSEEGIETETILSSLKDKIFSYKENIEINYIGFGFMFRNIINWKQISLNSIYKNHNDSRWVDNIFILQKGKAINETWKGGSYRLTSGGQFGTKSEEEKSKINKEWVDLNKKFFLSLEDNPKPIIILDAFLYDKSSLVQLKKYLSFIKELEIPLMLVTNSDFDNSLIKEFDYILYDSNNRLFEKKYKRHEHIVFYFSNDYYKFSLGTEGLQRHGLSVLSNLYHSTNLAKSLGFTHFYRIEYDCFIENLQAIKDVINQVKNSGKKGYGYLHKSYLSFQMFYMDLEYFTKNFPQINNEQEYIDFLPTWTSKDWLSAEEFLYEMIKNSEGGTDNVIIKPSTLMFTDFGNCLWNTCMTPIESAKIKDKYVAAPFKIAGINDAVALITWNTSTEEQREAHYELTFPDGTIENIIHNIEGINSHKIFYLNLQDKEIQIKITYGGDSTIFNLSKHNVINLENTYENHPH